MFIAELLEHLSERTSLLVEAETVYLAAKRDISRSERTSLLVEAETVSGIVMNCEKSERTSLPVEIYFIVLASLKTLKS